MKLKFAFFFILLSGPLYPTWDWSEALINWSAQKDLSFSKRKENLLVIINKAYVLREHKCAADAYRRMGTLFKNNGQLDSAIEAYIRSVNIAVKEQYKLSEASSLNQLGAIYLELQNNKKALIHFNQAYEAYKLVPDLRGMSDAAFNIAETNYNLHKLPETEIFCNQSLQHCRKNNDTCTIGYRYDLLSRINLIKNHTIQALRYSRLAVSLLRRENDISGLIPALIQIGHCQKTLKRVDSAMYFYKESYELAKEHQYKKWIAETAFLLTKMYESKALFSQALPYLKVYSAYKDSLFNENIIFATINAATRYDTEKKEMELSTQQKLTQNSQLLNLVLAVLVILLLITILVIIRNFAQRKKIGRKESELQNANAMIQGQDVERERIARELHDRVGSMLSTVKLHFTSMEDHMGELLKVQGKSYEKAIELLDETYEEVRRISHDLDNGLLGRFGLRTAMLQLVQVIESTNRLKILYIDNDLPPEIYKPFETDLYRITQEMLGNTIKYAGAKEISIQLSRNNENLVYSYEDDGVGFEKENLENAQGIGYKNINARVKKMNGTWHLDTSPRNGVNLIIELPINGNTNNNS